MERYSILAVVCDELDHGLLGVLQQPTGGPEQGELRYVGRFY
jgi:hypothetical protein